MMTTAPTATCASTAILTEIARQHLNIATLQTQNSDGADFHDVAVWNIEAALLAAFAAGRASRDLDAISGGK